MVGYLLCAVFGFSAFSVSSAFGLESTWLVNGTKPTGATSVDAIFTLETEDTKVGPFGESGAVSCKGTGEGTIGPGAADTITKLGITDCTPVKICEIPTGLTFLKLPWTTKVELIGAVFYDDIVASTGEVEYKFICTILGIKVEDTCKLALARSLLENTGSNVKGIFSKTDSNQPAVTCSRGGTGTGLLMGSIEYLSTAGATIAVSEG
jgi:hypothetical protein